MSKGFLKREKGHEEVSHGTALGKFLVVEAAATRKWHGHRGVKLQYLHTKDQASLVMRPYKELYYLMPSPNDLELMFNNMALRKQKIY